MENTIVHPLASAVEKIRRTRIFLLDSIKSLSTEELNTIPKGFNNNIAWNLGHMAAVQQGICYIRSGNEPLSGQMFYDAFKPGSKPEITITETEIEEIKNLLVSSLDRLVEDYDKGLFKNYGKWASRYAIEITTVEEAVNFLLFHEGLHFGTINALKRVIVQ